jgi:ACR3 family arsenite transporter
MWKFLGYLQKILIWAIPAMMLAGLAAGYLMPVEPLKNTIAPLTFLMAYPLMVKLPFEKVFCTVGLHCQRASRVVNFALIPFIAFGLGRLFFPDTPLIAIGLLLAALWLTSAMTSKWSGFASGDIQAAIKMTVIGMLAGFVATPFYVRSLIGAVVEIPLFPVFKQIALMVVLPMALGYLTQKGLVRKFGREVFRRDVAKRFPMISILGVLGTIFVATALQADSILTQSETLVLYCFPLAFLYLINFVLKTLLAGLIFPRGEGIALEYCPGMRNLAIALVIDMILFQEAGATIAIIIALAYVVQVQAAAWYVRFSDHIFGAAPSG